MPGAHPLAAWLPPAPRVNPVWGEEWTADGVSYRSFRLVTLEWAGQPVSTYGVAGWPAGASGPLPGLLHVHGGGQTAAPEEVAFCARMGYAAVSFDWTGDHPERPAGQTTRYPEGFPHRQGDWLRCLDANGTPQTRYLHGLQAARQCLTVLASLPNVDAARLGAYGISWGGFLGWLLNSVDDRLKAVVAIYGTGGLHWPGHLWNAAWAEIGEAARADWMRLIEPRGHVPFQHAPICFLNGTNDFFGGLDVASELLPAIPVAWRADYSPNSDHHVSGGGLKLLEGWFGHYLRGGPAALPTPGLRAKVDGARCRITTDAPPAEGELWYSVGRQPHGARCWQVRTDWSPDGAIEAAFAGPVWLYVRRRDPRTGLTVCSAPVCRDLPDRAAPERKVLFEGGQRDGIGIYMSTQPRMAGDADELFEMTAEGLFAREPEQPVGGLMLRTPSAPGGRAGAAAGLEIEVRGVRQIRVNCRTFLASRDLTEDGTLCLRASDFRAGDQALPGLDAIDQLMIALEPRPGERAGLVRVAWAEA